jgi:hypothetical protein
MQMICLLMMTLSVIGMITLNEMNLVARMMN